MATEPNRSFPQNYAAAFGTANSGAGSAAWVTPDTSSPAEVSDTDNSTGKSKELAQRSARKRKREGPNGMAEVQAKPGANDPTKGPPGENSDDDADDGGGGGKGGKGKSRRELPAGAVAILKAWLLSPEHFTHPYPTPQDQVILMQKTGIDKKQLKNWFTNARRRIWKPMLKKQLEQGKLQAGASGVVTIPGAMGTLPGGPPPPTGAPPPGHEYAASSAPAPPPELHAHYQHALQQQHQQPQQQQQGYDAYGQAQYGQQQQPSQQQHQQQPSPQQTSHPGAQTGAALQEQYSSSPYYAAQQPYGQPQQQQPQQQQQQHQGTSAPGAHMSQSNSIGSLPPIPPSGGSSNNMTAMNKTDSHAVLMELFARDQDLVRQATEGQRLKAQAAAAAMGSSAVGASSDMNQPQQSQHQPSSGGMLGSQHPMKMAAQGNKMGSVPSLNSWPHFSSVSSLNNLGTMTGVKSITNMSEADLARQGNLNKKGNLAQVKSMESMGRADSYAFLEVFFGDPNTPGASQGPTGQRGVKREREEDNDVGLSLDADESPSGGGGNIKPTDMTPSNPGPTPAPGAPCPAPLPGEDKDSKDNSDGGTLKRAYDDALAARGLISVSRSCEKLTDLALPAKMQRTLSQEYLRQQMHPGASSYGNYGYSGANDNQVSASQSQLGETYQQPSGDSQQYPGQNPGQQHASAPVQQHQYQMCVEVGSSTLSAPLSDPSMPGASVEVPVTTKCALCQLINVDTQLRPCGHMFHGRCLKPSLKNAQGPPQCPIDGITMQSAVLALPTDENGTNSSQQQQPTGVVGSGPMASFQSNANSQGLSEAENGNS